MIEAQSVQPATPLELEYIRAVEGFQNYRVSNLGWPASASDSRDKILARLRRSSNPEAEIADEVNFWAGLSSSLSSAAGRKKVS